MPPADLDRWLSDPSLRVRHRRTGAVDPERLWRAAQGIQLSDTRVMGRLVRWRIPGIPREASFDQLFRNYPFLVLEELELGLVTGLVGKIWTLRRDYPALADPEEFRGWSRRGTVRVLFANWVEPSGDGGAAMISETRVEALGTEGRIGLAAVRPFVAASQQLVATEALEAALERAQRL